mgnify:CR=1 FL=1
MSCRPWAIAAALTVLAPAGAALQAGAGAPGQGNHSAPESSCFSVEALPDADREAAADLFLRILDSEGLYTVVGGTKPASSGFVRFSVEVEQASAAEVDRCRRLLESFRCAGAVFATVHHFAKTYENPKTGRRERPYEGIVFAVEPLRQLVRNHAPFFSRLGVTEHSHPVEILMAVEYATDGDRWRGYGWMYGFPSAAVDFFVDAGLRQQQTGEFVRRRFVSLPTFARQERGVVYAVAEDAPETEADRTFRRLTEATLAEYRRRRAQYVGPGKPGVVRLLRDWYCGAGACRLPAVPEGPVSGEGEKTAAQATSGFSNRKDSPSRRQAASAAR